MLSYNLTDTRLFSQSLVGAQAVLLRSQVNIVTCQNSRHSEAEGFEDSLLFFFFFPSSFLSAGAFQECCGRVLWQQITKLRHSPAPPNGFSLCSRLKREKPEVYSSPPETRQTLQEKNSLRFLQGTLSWRCLGKKKITSGSYQQEFI